MHDHLLPLWKYIRKHYINQDIFTSTQEHDFHNLGTGPHELLSFNQAFSFFELPTCVGERKNMFKKIWSFCTFVPSYTVFQFNNYTLHFFQFFLWDFYTGESSLILNKTLFTFWITPSLIHATFIGWLLKRVFKCLQDVKSIHNYRIMMNKKCHILR